jgi:hypothetical protein
MNLNGNCCRCVGILIMLIGGIATVSSVAQAGSEATSPVRGPSGDASGKKWLSPSKSTTAEIPAKNPVLLAEDTAKLETIVKKIEGDLGKTGNVTVSAPEFKSITDIISRIGRALVGIHQTNEVKSDVKSPYEPALPIKIERKVEAVRREIESGKGKVSEKMVADLKNLTDEVKQWIENENEKKLKEKIKD